MVVPASFIGQWLITKLLLGYREIDFTLHVSLDYGVLKVTFKGYGDNRGYNGILGKYQIVLVITRFCTNALIIV